jgi:hypothetical protein
VVYANLTTAVSFMLERRDGVILVALGRMVNGRLSPQYSAEPDSDRSTDWHGLGTLGQHKTGELATGKQLGRYTAEEPASIQAALSEIAASLIKWGAEMLKGDFSDFDALTGIENEAAAEFWEWERRMREYYAEERRQRGSTAGP